MVLFYCFDVVNHMVQIRPSWSSVSNMNANGYRHAVSTEDKVVSYGHSTFMYAAPWWANNGYDTTLFSCLCLSVWILITASKRSVGQGNVFTHVCHSVYSGRGSLYDVTSCLAAWSHVPSGRGLCLLSHVPSGGYPWQRPPWTETPLDRDPHLDREPLGQRSPLDRYPPLDRDPPSIETPLDRGMHSIVFRYYNLFETSGGSCKTEALRLHIASQFPLQTFRNIIIRFLLLARVPGISNAQKRLILYVLTD